MKKFLTIILILILIAIPITSGIFIIRDIVLANSNIGQTDSPNGDEQIGTTNPDVPSEDIPSEDDEEIDVEWPSLQKYNDILISKEGSSISFSDMQQGVYYDDTKVFVVGNEKVLLFERADLETECLNIYDKPNILEVESCQGSMVGMTDFGSLYILNEDISLRLPGNENGLYFYLENGKQCNLTKLQNKNNLNLIETPAVAWENIKGVYLFDYIPGGFGEEEVNEILGLNLNAYAVVVGDETILVSCGEYDESTDIIKYAEYYEGLNELYTIKGYEPGKYFVTETEGSEETGIFSFEDGQLVYGGVPLKEISGGEEVSVILT